MSADGNQFSQGPQTTAFIGIIGTRSLLQTGSFANRLEVVVVLTAGLACR